MKLSKLFFGLATAAMFAACSSDDIVEQQQPQVNIDGEGYMAFSIGMPEQVSTRADQDNDQFHHGLAAEYAVKDVILLLFQGADDASATFHSAYILDNNWNGKANTDADKNVTADKKYVTKVTGSIANPRAFVVLNNNGIFNVDGAGALKINGSVIGVGTKFSEIQKLTASAALDLQASAFHQSASTGFLMMNAPLFDKQGTTTTAPAGGNISVLAPVAAGAIYQTKTEAEAATAKVTPIYVERAVAKVTVKEATTVAKADNFKTVVLNAWSLDNTNTSSYLVRNTDGFNTWAQLAASTNGIYRFPGGASVRHANAATEGAPDTESVLQYRTYFAKDLNYGKEGLFADFNHIAAADITTAFGSDMYCAENTFDVERMKYKNTTRVLVKATVTPKDGEPTVGTGFYSAPGDDKFYDEASMKNAAWNKVYAKLAAEADKLTGLGAVGYNVTVSTDHKSFTVKTTTTITPASDASAEVKTLVNELASTAGKTYTVKQLGYGYYADGVVYYEVRVKHFGDTYCPWAAHDASTIDQAYPTTNRDANFLGRWGMLRNNWYELSVSAVNKMGYMSPEDLNLYPTTPDPEDPDPYNPENPDDNKKSEQWVSIDVNILSWAQRFQDVIF